MYSRSRDQGVALRGFTEIQAVLKAIDSGQAGELRKRLKRVGESVAAVARENVEHKTGRHFGSPSLSSGIKVAITRNSAAVYSASPHGGVQNFGGRVGRDHLTVIRRADVSHYMTKAVASSRDDVADEMDSLLDWLINTFEGR